MASSVGNTHQHHHEHHAPAPAPKKDRVGDTPAPGVGSAPPPAAPPQPPPATHQHGDMFVGKTQQGRGSEPRCCQGMLPGPHELEPQPGPAPEPKSTPQPVPKPEPATQAGPQLPAGVDFTMPDPTKDTFRGLPAYGQTIGKPANKLNPNDWAASGRYDLDPSGKLSLHGSATLKGLHPRAASPASRSRRATASVSI